MDNQSEKSSSLHKSEYKTQDSKYSDKVDTGLKMTCTI
jgi:hypothetical protein